MTYFISGHRDITPEEFEKFYVPAIVDVIDTCNDNYDDEAWEKAYDTVDLGDLEVRDCEYSDDEITLLEE